MSLRDDLKKTLDEAEWVWLAPHVERGALILVSLELDLLGVAEKAALNDQEQIGSWIAGGFLTKPTPEQIDAWNQSPQRKFLSIVIQPWVFAQEHLMN